MPLDPDTAYVALRGQLILMRATHFPESKGLGRGVAKWVNAKKGEKGFINSRTPKDPLEASVESG